MAKILKVQCKQIHQKIRSVFLHKKQQNPN